MRFGDTLYGLTHCLLSHAPLVTVAMPVRISLDPRFRCQLTNMSLANAVRLSRLAAEADGDACQIKTERNLFFTRSLEFGVFPETTKLRNPPNTSANNASPRRETKAKA